MQSIVIVYLNQAVDHTFVLLCVFANLHEQFSFDGVSWVGKLFSDDDGGLSPN